MNVNNLNSCPSPLIFNCLTPSYCKDGNVNGGTSPAVWTSLAPSAEEKGETVDFSKYSPPANADKFVLQLPSSEVVYKRSELFTGGKLGDNTAYCSTYSERRISLGDSVLSISHSGGYFIIDPDGQKFGKSGADIKNIRQAAEETLERINRSSEQSTLKVDLSADAEVNGNTAKASLEFAMRHAVYRYSKASATKGNILFKNGGVGIYRENALKYAVNNFTSAQSIFKIVF